MLPISAIATRYQHEPAQLPDHGSITLLLPLVALKNSAAAAPVHDVEMTDVAAVATPWRRFMEGAPTLFPTAAPWRSTTVPTRHVTQLEIYLAKKTLPTNEDITLLSYLTQSTTTTFARKREVNIQAAIHFVENLRQALPQFIADRAADAISDDRYEAPTTIVRLLNRSFGDNLFYAFDVMHAFIEDIHNDIIWTVPTKPLQDLLALRHEEKLTAAHLAPLRATITGLEEALDGMRDINFFSQMLIDLRAHPYYRTTYKELKRAQSIREKLEKKLSQNAHGHLIKNEF